MNPDGFTARASEAKARPQVKLPWLHGGDVVARQLSAVGISHLFTLTGGHIAAVFDGCGFAGIDLVDFRHEQAAVHAAEGYARTRRQLAAAAVTAGPGVTNAITGLANAYYAGTPLLVLGGRNPLATDGAGNLQDAPHIELVRPVVKSAQTAFSVDRVPDVLYDAYRTALAPRSGPSFVDLPIEVQLAQISLDAVPALRVPLRQQLAVPDPDLVKRVVEALAQSRRPVIVAGSGCYWARAEESLDAFARATAAPVFLNGMARGLLGRGHPSQAQGGRTRALLACDLVIVLGADFDFRLGFGQPHALNKDAVVVQVDPDIKQIGRNRHVDIGVAGDIDAFLRATLCFDGRYARKGEMDASWMTHSVSSASTDVSSPTDASPIHPKWFCSELAKFVGADSTMIGDGGDIVAMFAAEFAPGGPGKWMDPGPFGCLGVGAPFAIGAKLAAPSEPVAVLFGDGSFGFNAFELEAAARQKIPFVAMIGNDGAWGEMRTFQEDLFGGDDLSAQYLSQDTQYEKVAEGLGVFGQRVEKASELVPALERAFASSSPALINVILDPKYRNRNATISGRHVAMSYGKGDAHAFRRRRY